MGFLKSKERRKTQKYRNILTKLFPDVHIIDGPTEYLVICNGGLANGLSKEILLNKLPINIVVNIAMPTSQSISFIQLKSDAFDKLDGFHWENGGPAFVAYVNVIPTMPCMEETYTPPPGLIILDNFITKHEEDLMLDCLALDESSDNLKHRQVKHFGYEFRYSDNRADLESAEVVSPIPEMFHKLWDRLQQTSGVDFCPDQCTVNRYLPGQGIPPHVDTHSAFTEVIACLSLQSSIVMDWRKSDTDDHRCILIPRFSLCLFTDDARYAWTHGITLRKSDVVVANGKEGGLTLVPRSIRTSVTFRRTRSGPCSPCPFPALCDTQPSTSAPTVAEQLASKLESTSVHQVYEDIAEHFSMTRHKPWPNVVKFINTFQPGDVVLDVGCGNGKYLGVRRDLACIGVDRSAALLQLCAKTYVSRDWLVQADCLHLPVRDGSVDGVISIAVLHHLSTKHRRLRGVEEIARVLRPGGRALIYVWAKNQESNNKKSSYLKQVKDSRATPSTGNENKHGSNCEKEVEGVRLPVHTNRTNFSSADMFVPWLEKASGAKFLRYYHVFEEEELKILSLEVPLVQCIEYYYDQGNWCIILQKNCPNNAHTACE